MANPRLRITDGTLKVDLLDGIDGFWLAEWIPMATPEREGIWSQSAYSPGRRMVYQTYDNTIDTFSINARKETQDQAIAALRALRKLLIKANRYWVDTQQYSPVWIEARGDCETETRYALIRDHRMPEDRNPHATPFSNNGSGSAVLDGLTLTIEHAGWRSQPPGVGECVLLSALSEFYEATTLEVSVAAGSDDAYVFLDDPSRIFLTDVDLNLGSYGFYEATVVGLRFLNITVPQGAHILDAYITFECAVADVGEAALCKILGYNGDMSTFANRADFLTKYANVLPNYVEWNSGIKSWQLGNPYIVPGLAPVIQAMVDQPGWTLGFDAGIFIADNGSNTGTGYKRAAAFENLTYDPAKLTIKYITTTNTYGQEQTCLDQVFLSNKQNKANITDVYTYDASLAAFSANLANNSGLFDLLTNPVADQDILYLGCDNSFVDGGPFDNLIFDVVTAAIYTGAAYSEWEYWDGAAWSPLLVSDTTTLGVGAFSKEGVGSVHWIPPADWTAVAVNGVTAYWVRLIVTITAPPGDSISTPEHENRSIYTSVLAGALVANAQLLGDLRAAAKIALHVRSAAAAEGEPTEPYGHLNSVYLATRPVKGDGLFTPYLNCGLQNPSGLIFASYPDDGEAALTARITAPSGVALNLVPSGVLADELIGTFQFDGALAQEYYGKFRVFARVYQDGGVDGDFVLTLNVRNGSTSTVKVLGGLSPTADLDFQVLDFGPLTLPNNLIAGNELADLLVIDLVADVIDNTGELWVYDLILFPLDDWGGEFTTIDETQTATYIGVDQTLNVDSYGNPRAPRRAYVTNQSDVIAAWYKTRCNTPLSLPTEEHKIWVFMRRYLDGDWDAPPHLCVSAQLTASFWYKSMRGDT